MPCCDNLQNAAPFLPVANAPLGHQSSRYMASYQHPLEQNKRNGRIDVINPPVLAVIVWGMLMMGELVYTHEHMTLLDGPPRDGQSTISQSILLPPLMGAVCLQQALISKRQGKHPEDHESPEALAALRQYLQQYGYLGVPLAEKSSILEELGDAIGLMQQSFSIPETRSLDAVTYNVVTQPRCGQPDIVGGQPKRGVRRVATLMLDPSHSANEVGMGAEEFAYFSGNPRWKSRYELTWALSATEVTRRVLREDVRAAFVHAFYVWAATAPVFSFKEVQNYEDADVKISFVEGEHGDSQNFDGVLGIIAHAFSPEDGRVHFDNAEFWSADLSSDPAPQALDLVSVAIHEVGHVIGLAHSPVRHSVMFPSIATRHMKRDLSDDDVQGVRELYGLDSAPPPNAARKPIIGINHGHVTDKRGSMLIIMIALSLFLT